MAEAGCKWVLRLGRGAKLVFWITLVSVPLTNIGAMAVPLLGGARSDLRWITLLWTLAELFLLIGVYELSAPTTFPEEIRVPDSPRRLLRICAVLAFCGQADRLMASIIPNWPQIPYMLPGEILVESVAMSCLFLYLKRLAQRFGEASLTRSLGLVAWIGATANLLLILGFESMYEDLGMSLSMYYVLFWSRALFRLVTWVWILRVLWRCSTRIPVAAEGRCLNCGYPYDGLLVHRCPECSLPFGVTGASDKKGCQEEL